MANKFDLIEVLLLVPAGSEAYTALLNDGAGRLVHWAGARIATGLTAEQAIAHWKVCAAEDITIQGLPHVS